MIRETLEGIKQTLAAVAAFVLLLVPLGRALRLIRGSIELVKALGADDLKQLEQARQARLGVGRTIEGEFVRIDETISAAYPAEVITIRPIK